MCFERGVLVSMIEEENKTKAMKDLGRLKDDELKDNILDINRNSYQKIGKMAYCYFISTSVNLNQLFKYKNLGSSEEKELIKTIYQHSIDIFKNSHGVRKKLK